MNKAANTVERELERVRKEAGGVLRPTDVVAWAEDESNPLHSCFEWDDRRAGQEYRLWQARALIRVTVCILAECGEEPKP